MFSVFHSCKLGTNGPWMAATPGTRVDRFLHVHQRVSRFLAACSGLSLTQPTVSSWAVINM